MVPRGWSKFVAGRSREGREIFAISSFPPSEEPPEGITLILGGVHGDEPATHDLVAEFADQVSPAERPENPLLILPLLNPDGLLRHSRYNARGVDLNRNCETGWSPDSEEPPGDMPWSEPENQALHDLILTFRPAKIVTLHWALAELDADGDQSRPLLDAMWASLSEKERAPYRVVLSKKPTLPGSLGAWCGYTVRYPDGTQPAIVTLELPAEPEKPRGDELPPDHFATAQIRWRKDASGYLAAARPAVVKMLLAAWACPA